MTKVIKRDVSGETCCCYLPYLLRIRNLQDALPQVLALEHTQKALNRIIHTFCDMVDALQTPFSNPLAHVLVSGFRVRHDVGVEHNEAFPSDPSSYQLRVVLDALAFAWLVVVLGDAATCDCEGY